LIPVLATLISYYRQLLYPLFDVLRYVLPISIPDWYRDLSFVSWTLSAIFVRVYIHYATLAHIGDSIRRSMGDVPFARDDDKIIAVPQQKLWLSKAQIVAFALAVGLLLFGYFLPLYSLYVYLRPRLWKAGVTWQLVRYCVSRKSSVKDLYIGGDAYVVRRVEFVRLILRSGILDSTWKVFSLYITYLVHVLLIVIAAFVINVGLWFSA
jgi:hypothetical protein